jgi:hypothetical protein
MSLHDPEYAAGSTKQWLHWHMLQSSASLHQELLASWHISGEIHAPLDNRYLHI